MSVPPAEFPILPPLIDAIEAGGSLIIALYVASALLRLVKGEGIPKARITVAQGAVLALSLKVAAALLKTLVLRTWSQILVFALILSLRTLIKRSLVWEIRQLMPKLQSEASG